MREIVQQSQFKKDLKRIARSGRYQVQDLLQVVAALVQDLPLEPKHHDHPLVGNWQDYRECHIKPDWLLIYKRQDPPDHNQPKMLILVRTGSHAELFD